MLFSTLVITAVLEGLLLKMGSVWADGSSHERLNAIDPVFLDSPKVVAGLLGELNGEAYFLLSLLDGESMLLKRSNRGMVGVGDCNVRTSLEILLVDVIGDLWVGEKADRGPETVLAVNAPVLNLGAHGAVHNQHSLRVECLLD